MKKETADGLKRELTPMVAAQVAAAEKSDKKETPVIAGEVEKMIGLALGQNDQIGAEKHRPNKANDPKGHPRALVNHKFNLPSDLGLLKDFEIRPVSSPYSMKTTRKEPKARSF